MLIYIAGPMKHGHRIYNIKAAIDIAEKIALAGHTPYIPHLNDFWELIYQHDYEFWLRMDFEIIKKCDILIRIPGHSEGADREIELARELKLPIYFGLDEFKNSEFWK